MSRSTWRRFLNWAPLALFWCFSLGRSAIRVNQFPLRDTGPPRRIVIGLSAAGGRGLASGCVPKRFGLGIMIKIRIGIRGSPPHDFGVIQCDLVCLGVLG